MTNRPNIIEETSDFAVVFKPPRMHSAPLAKKEGGTLLEWFTAREKAAQSATLMHRLDFETHGLVLFAKTAESFEFLKQLQDKGGFIKEYSAVCESAVPGAINSIPGFPPPPALASGDPSAEEPLVIKSFFRPFGPGRKLVRPVIEEGKKEIAKDSGSFYRTEIIGINKNVFTVRLKRGFRHQIRCHLCWAGTPILNDPLYPQPSETSAPDMALRACALFFTDPSTGKPHEYRIESL
ncbi:MAG: RNA pseudouridine synthase [Treponema sp.]|nr:RNA pseudouridine synthase [Treponema sp.]